MNKIITPKRIVLAAFASTVLSFSAFSQKGEIFMENGLHGLKSETGETIVAPQCLSLKELANGYFLYEMPDPAGAVMAKHEEQGGQDENQIHVEGIYGLVSPNLKVYDANYKNVKLTAQNYFIVHDGQHYSIMDRGFNKLSSFESPYIEEIKEGFLIQKDGLYGIYDQKLLLKIPMEYKKIEVYDTKVEDLSILGYVALQNSKGMWGIVKRLSFERVFDHIYTELDSDFAKDYIMVKRDGLYGFIDKHNLKMIIPPSYERVIKGKNGFSIVEKGGKYGLMRQSDLHVLVPPKYDNIIYRESDGNYDIFLAGKAGLLHTENLRVVIVPKYDKMAYNTHFSAVSLNGKAGLVSMKTFREVVELIYDAVYVLDDFENTFVVESKGKFGVFDGDLNKLVLPVEYGMIDSTDFCFSYLKVIQKDKLGLVDPTNNFKTIVAPEWDTLECETKEKAVAANKKGRFEINLKTFEVKPIETVK